MREKDEVGEGVVFGLDILANDGAGRGGNGTGVDLQPAWCSSLVIILCSDMDIHLPNSLTTLVSHVHPFVGAADVPLALIWFAPAFIP
jgi:hypothetical protein